MRITDPVLAPDVSLWVDHINAKEFEDGGCQSIVIGLYRTTINGKWVLNATSRKQCQEVVTNSSLALQVYYWDDIILNPQEQADWVAETLQIEGLPIKWVWADQEQWWANWNEWYQFRNGSIPASSVTKASPANISSHNLAFNQRLKSKFPNMGVYTNKGFVASWALPMDTWLPDYAAWVPQYGRQPATATQMTWEELKANWLPTYDIVLSAGQLPAQVKGHQFTGDRCILPGSYTEQNLPMALDVNVFSKAFIDSLKGIIPEPPPLPHPAICPTCGQAWIDKPANQYYVNKLLVNVRSEPRTTAAWVAYARLNEIFTVYETSGDYSRVGDGRWIFSQYLTKKG